MIDSGPRTPPEWPSREEWAERRRTFYADDDTIWCSDDIDLYATDAEIAEAIRAIEDLIRECRRKMLAARKEIGHLLQQAGETRLQHVKRWIAMDEADKARMSAYNDPQWKGDDLRRALKEIRAGSVPSRVSFGGINFGLVREWPASVVLICERYRTARDQAYEAKLKEIEATPIDDAAWESELARRRQIEASGW
jgi:hypothetical protein